MKADVGIRMCTPSDLTADPEIHGTMHRTHPDNRFLCYPFRKVSPPVLISIALPPHVAMSPLASITHPVGIGIKCVLCLPQDTDPRLPRQRQCRLEPPLTLWGR